jgi:hypothetical protein
MDKNTQIEQPAAPDQEPVRAKARPAGQDRATLGLLLAAALIAVGGIGFALGHVTAPSSAAGAAPNASGRISGGGAFRSLAPGETFNPGAFGAGRAGAGGLGSVAGGVTGTVQSISPTSMTVLLSSGQSVTIDLTGSTTYHGETSATAGQVQVGTSVSVQIDTTALASQSPNPSASGALGGRTLTAKDVLITNP